MINYYYLWISQTLIKNVSYYTCSCAFNKAAFVKEYKHLKKICETKRRPTVTTTAKHKSMSSSSKIKLLAVLRM